MSQVETVAGPDEIKCWIEGRQGRPTVVKGTEGEDFREPDGKLEEFFQTFENRKLAFLQQDQAKESWPSRSFKLVGRDGCGRTGRDGSGPPGEAHQARGVRPLRRAATAASTPTPSNAREAGSGTDVAPGIDMLADMDITANCPRSSPAGNPSECRLT